MRLYLMSHAIGGRGIGHYLAAGPGRRVEWETVQTTQAETRYGSLHTDLTGLSRGLSAADLPGHCMSCGGRRGKFRGLFRKADEAQRLADLLPDIGAAGVRPDEP